MTLGAILIMSFITLVLGFGCVLVIDDAIRKIKQEKCYQKAHH
jgi:hypothetical protein